MPSPATITGPAGAPAGKDAPALPPAPFVRGSFEHVEQFIDTSNAISASTLPVAGGPIDVPAYGFLRAIVLTVTATGGTGTAAVYKEDAPWSVIQEVALLDVNGAPILGPFSGYDLYLINKYGGANNFNTNPIFYSNYSAPATSGNFAFMLRLPVEISRRDALGSLPNQNAGQTYKLRITQAATTDVYSTNPTTLPTVRFRAHLEAWAPPAPVSLTGRPNAVQPPATGTAQFWTKTGITLNSGAQTLRFPRVGNLIRQHLLIFRNSTPARNSTNFPDPLSLFWDGKLVFTMSQDLLTNYMIERNLFTGPVSQLDTGVFQISYAHDFDGHVGDEMRDLWLTTSQSTRLEVQGTFGAAGTLTVLTNDVAPSGDVFMG